MSDVTLKQPSATVNISREPEMVTRGDRPFAYLEKRGPFMKQAPQAWKEFWGVARSLAEAGLSNGMVGLSHVDTSKQGDEAYIYQAGMLLDHQPATLQPPLQYRDIPACNYARFLLTGPYHQLAYAYPEAFRILSELKIARRDDFCIETYLNDPSATAEDQLQTEILIPVP